MTGELVKPGQIGEQQGALAAELKLCAVGETEAKLTLVELNVRGPAVEEQLHDARFFPESGSQGFSIEKYAPDSRSALQS